MTSIVTDEPIDGTEIFKIIIPYLPTEDEKKDLLDAAQEINDEELMENKYYKQHYHLYGYEIENFHEMIKLIMCKIAFAASKVETDKGKLQQGGGMGAIIKTVLKKYNKHKTKIPELIMLAAGMYMTFVSIYYFIVFKDSKLMQTETLKPEKSFHNSESMALILSSNDNYKDKSLVVPKINLAQKANTMITEITVEDFFWGALGYETDIVVNFFVIIEEEANKQVEMGKTMLADIYQDDIVRDMFNKFMITQGSTIRAEPNEKIDMTNIRTRVLEKVSRWPLHERVFGYYRWSFVSSISDLIKSVRTALNKFKRTINADLQNRASDALFEVESHFNNIMRDGAASVYMLFVGIGFLGAAHRYYKSRKKEEGRKMELEAIIRENNAMRRLIINMNDDGKDGGRILRNQLENMTNLERSGVKFLEYYQNKNSNKELPYLLLENKKQGGKRKRRKTRRKSRRKSKKRKSKRKKRKRKKTKRKRR